MIDAYTWVLFIYNWCVWMNCVYEWLCLHNLWFVFIIIFLLVYSLCLLMIRCMYDLCLWTTCMNWACMNYCVCVWNWVYLRYEFVCDWCVCLNCVYVCVASYRIFRFLYFLTKLFFFLKRQFFEGHRETKHWQNLIFLLWEIFTRYRYCR